MSNRTEDEAKGRRPRAKRTIKHTARGQRSRAAPTIRARPREVREAKAATESMSKSACAHKAESLQPVDAADNSQRFVEMGQRLMELGQQFLELGQPALEVRLDIGNVTYVDFRASGKRS